MTLRGKTVSNCLARGVGQLFVHQPASRNGTWRLRTSSTARAERRPSAPMFAILHFRAPATAAASMTFGMYGMMFLGSWLILVGATAAAAGIAERRSASR
jgi:hypothetical protein